MLKRFLKFLKGDEAVIDEHFEGSYLDHILTQVKPSITSHLEECPDHDPTLLLVVGILRGSMPNSWHADMRKPLCDKRTPGPKPPPPPTQTLEMPLGEDEDADDASELIEAATENTAEFDVPENNATVSIQSRITEEIDISELQEHLAAEESRDNTVEIDRNAVEAGLLLPRLDAEDVLQAGRLFLGLLIENDKSPPEIQLSITETALARDLLLGYFVGNQDFEDKARKLLNIVEKKFADGLFSQARLLLQLFHTDENTKVTNDRNLFYEDMILRLGIKRRHKIPEEDLKNFRALPSSDDARLRETFQWLDQKALIKCHLFLRTDVELETWKTVLAPCTRETATEHFLKVIPPQRWRPVDRVELPIRKQVEAHISDETTRRYVVNHLRTCYFVLRAVGDTGLEGYLDSFFSWTEKQFDLNGTMLMPLVYNRSLSENTPMQDIFNALYEEFFATKAKAKVKTMTQNGLSVPFDKTLGFLKTCDLGEFAPGYYDLGGFVYDQIFEFPYPNPEFNSKLHRLT